MKKKLKNLPKNFDLTDCKLDGKYIISGWNKGFWVKKKMGDGRVYPITFDNWDEIKDWVIEIPLHRMGDLL